MKKLKLLSVFMLIASSAMIIASNTKELNALDGKVETSTIEAWKFAGGWETTTSYTNDGAMVVIPGASSKGASEAWKYSTTIPNDSMMSPSFSLKNNGKIAIEISAKLFDNDGNTISKSQNSDALDIYVYSKVGDAQLGMLRIWTASGGATNGDHSFNLYGNNWDNYSSGSWIKGRATADSSFIVQFDKDNFFSSYVGGQDGLVCLDNRNQALLNHINNNVKNADEIYFKICGENGFTNDTEITVKSINSQSLANSDGCFTDTIAPKFNNEAVSSTLNINEEYTIPTTAFDLLSDVTYSVTYNGNEIEGKTFTPTKAGNNVVTLNAKDSANNVASKELEFEVVSNIKAPEITATPSINNQTINYFTNLVFDNVTYVDETNAATSVLKIYKNNEEFATLNENEDNKFTYFVGSEFEGGEYEFVYEVTNSAGTTTSNKIKATFTLEALNVPSFVTPSATNMIADYVDEGIRLRSSVNFKEFDFGEFDVEEGIDVKFIVNQLTKNNQTNETNYVNLIFTNKEDSNYKVMYRVWVGHEGADRPTNVYISYDGENYKDITDTGWISRNVDGVAGKYHMLFNLEETFQGERNSGVQRVDNAYDELVKFFKAAPSTIYNVALEESFLNAGEVSNFEMILTELNGQSFAAPISWNDTYLKVKTAIPEKIALNETLNIKAYAKDINGNSTIRLDVITPNNQTSTIDFENGLVSYTFAELGNYKLKVVAKGTNNNEVVEEFDVVCKSSIADLTIELKDSYKETYSLQEEITIIDATYSDNVVSKEIIIKTPSNEEVKVNALDKYKFTKPGIYTITYIAKDDAKPVNNEVTKTITINVPDTQKPVVEVDVNDTYVVNSKVTLNVKVTDDSDYDITVTVTKPDNSSVKLTSSNNTYEFEANAAGKYVVKVIVEDIYGNKETITKEITVNEESKKGCKGEIATSMTLIATLGALIILKKSKKQ